MKKIKLRKLIAIVLVGCIVFKAASTLAPVANADDSNPLSVMQGYKVRDIEGSKSQSLLDDVDSEVIEKASGIIRQYDESAKIVEEVDAISEVMDKNGNINKVVSHKIVGENLDKDNYITHVFDKKNNLLTEVIFLITMGEDGSANSYVIQDGEKYMEIYAEDYYGENIADHKAYIYDKDGNREEIDMMQNKSWLSCMQSCIASQGISMLLISTIFTVCAVVCVGTVGAGCLVCVGAWGTSVSAAFGYCGGKC